MSQRKALSLSELISKKAKLERESLRT